MSRAIGVLISLFSLVRPLSAQDPPPPEPDLPAAELLLERLRALDERTDTDPRSLLWNRLRTQYVLAVAREEWILEAQQTLEALRSPGADPSGPETSRIQAYDGALEVVRGKHAFWPRSKLNHVRQGLELLDAAVDRSPRDVEVRNLRLLSTFYLPFFFRRGDSARADLETLASLLLESPDALPPEDLVPVIDFVLERGTLAEETSTALRSLRARLAAASDAQPR